MRKDIHGFGSKATVVSLIYDKLEISPVFFFFEPISIKQASPSQALESSCNKTNIHHLDLSLDFIQDVMAYPAYYRVSVMSS